MWQQHDFNATFCRLNGRSWIGIDQSEEAIKAVTTKLNSIEDDLFSSKPEFQILTVEQKHYVQHNAASRAEE